MNDIAGLINTLIRFYIYVVIASAILSWLINFNVVNTQNSVISRIADLLYRVTEPALAPIRRYVPSFGGIDISPIVLIIGLSIVQILVRRLLA